MLSNCGAGKDSWESLGQQDIKPLNPKGNQAWIFIGRTDAEADIHWLPDAKSQFIGQPGYSLATWCEELTNQKRPWCWKDWRQEEKGTTEDEMVGWHHCLNGHEFGQAPGGGNGHRSLVCCSPWGQKESGVTELNWMYWFHWFFPYRPLSVSGSNPVSPHSI